MKKSFLSIFVIIALLGCSKDSQGENKASASIPDGVTFELNVSNGMRFNHESPKAKVHSATNKIVSFKATDWYFRIHGLGLEEEGVSETERLGKNNTILSMKVEINAKKVKVGCDPAKNPKGSFKRTELTNDTISGEFEVEFVSCDDYMTGKPVDYPKEPFTVTGRFNNFPLKK